MEILLNPEEWVTLQYPENSETTKNYKLSHYIIKTKHDDEILILHTITWSIYALSQTEYDNILTNETLIQNKVVVPSDLDELEIAHKVYLMRMTKPRPNYDFLTGYVLLTTTACNARCAYCYENDNIEKKETMTIETAENFIQFLISRIPKNNNRPIHIQWFGGEPLLNTRVINYIVDRLYELNIPFHCGMITNGFLLNEENINNLDKWKIETMQITLDGLNEDYNNAKNYIYSDIDAYMIVLQNIHNVLNNSNSRITIRFNATNDNIFKLYDTVNFLKDEFKEHYGKKITFYVAPLFEYLGANSIAIDGYWEELNRIETIVMVTKLSKCDNMLDKEAFKRERIDTNCMAFGGNAIAVAPDGTFTPCEHIKKEDIFGNVIDGVTDVEVIKKWQTFDGPEIQYCKDTKCQFHPMCPKFFKCDTFVVCSTEKQQNKKLQKAEKKLIRTRLYYNKQLNK